MTTVDLPAVNPADLTIETLVAAVDAVVEEAGEAFVTSMGQCRYVKDGKPCCLLGRAFDKLGLVDVPTMQWWDAQANASAKAVLEPLGTQPEVAMFAAEAQDANDSSVPWGTIRRWAHEALAEGLSFDAIRYADEEAADADEVADAGTSSDLD